jgi:UDP-glucose 4-epimerase
MKVLVTGGSGYVGSHVAKMLFEKGHSPVVFDLQAKMRPWASPNWPAVAGDINNKWSLDFLFEQHQFDAVIHLAASSEVGSSVWNPIKYYQNNVGGSAQVLEACRKHGVDKFVFSSTSSVYGEVHPSRLPTCEHYPKNPVTSYGSSKWAVECMLRDVDIAHNIRSVSLRYFNASGASPDGAIGEFRKHPTHLIPSIQDVLLGKKDKFIVKFPFPSNGNLFCEYLNSSFANWPHFEVIKNDNNGGVDEIIMSTLDEDAMRSFRQSMPGGDPFAKSEILPN